MPRPAWSLLTLAVPALVQVTLQRVNYPPQVSLFILYLAWAMVLLLTTSSMASTLGRERIMAILAWCLLAGSLGNVAAETYETFAPRVLAPDDLIRWNGFYPLSGHLNQPNNLADYLSIGLAATLYLYLKQALSLPWAVLGGSMILFGLSLTGSRSAWLFLAALFVLALAWRYRNKERAPWTAVRAAALALVAFQAMQLALPLLAPAAGLATANERILASGEGFAARLALWQDAWRMFLDHPWLGVGYQNYAWNHLELVRTGVSPFVGEQGTELTRWTHAHNLVLHLLAEFGLLALIPLVGLGWWLVRVFLRIASPEQWFLASALAVLAIHSLLEYPLWYANFLGLFAILAALADDRPREWGLSGPGVRRLGVLLLATGLGLAGFFYVTYTALERALANTALAHRTPQANALLKQDLQLAQANPFLDPFTDNLVAQLPITDTRQTGFLAMQLAMNERVMRYGGDADPYYYRTTLLWLLGRHGEAEDWLRNAIRVFPGSLEHYLGRSELAFGHLPEMAPLLEMIRAARTAAVTETPGE